MPKGPKGERRPADVIGNAVMVMKIATGQIEESTPSSRGQAGGKKGGPARAAGLSESERKAISRKGAAARWAKTSAD